MDWMEARKAETEEERRIGRGVKSSFFFPTAASGSFPRAELLMQSSQVSA